MYRTILNAKTSLVQDMKVVQTGTIVLLEASAISQRARYARYRVVCFQFTENATNIKFRHLRKHYDFVEEEKALQFFSEMIVSMYKAIHVK